MAAHTKAKVELLQDGFPTQFSTGDPMRGDLYWDSMTLAKMAFESLPAADPPVTWDDLPTFQKEQMRSSATHVYFYGGGSTAFEVAVLVAAGLPDPTPTLGSLDPATAVCGDLVDITMKCIGTGFTQESQIFFGFQPERTDFVSPTEVSTIVKPSLFPNPDANIQVFVRTPTLMDTNYLPFSMTVAAGTLSRGRKVEEKEDNGKRKDITRDRR